MLIKNLPKPIKELVFKRQIEQGNEPNEELYLSVTKSRGNFGWRGTVEDYDFWDKINEANYKPFFEKYGGVILCTSVEQGAKIIEYFKSLGVDTGFNAGSFVGYYYGLAGNCFAYYNEMFVKEKNIPIFTLDELGVQTAQEQPQQPELPEINFEGIEMEVSNNGGYRKRRKVLAKLNNKYLAFNTEQNSLFIWENARPIQQKVKVTKEQIAEAFNTTVELLEIES